MSKELNRMATDATAQARHLAEQIIGRHRRHVEQSPAIGMERQQYALAVLDDVEADLLPAITAATAAQEAELEKARVAAYRAARVFEPNMDCYGAAMAVYIAAFGEPGGDGAVVRPDGPKGVEALHAEHALLQRLIAQEAEIARLKDALTLIATSGASRGGQTTGPMKTYQMIAVAQEALRVGASHDESR